MNTERIMTENKIELISDGFTKDIRLLTSNDEVKRRIEAKDQSIFRKIQLHLIEGIDSNSTGCFTIELLRSQSKRVILNKLKAWAKMQGYYLYVINAHRKMYLVIESEHSVCPFRKFHMNHFNKKTLLVSLILLLATILFVTV